MKTKGFTLVEILVSMSIMVLIVIITGTFARNVVVYNTAGHNNLVAQLDGRKVLRTMVSELRTSASSVLGSYPIDTAATNTLIFFADLNNDGLSERVRYFFDTPTRTLRKGIVFPSESPLTYNLGNENVITLVSNLANGTSTPVFDYFDSLYAGTTTPMTLPINISSVRLIKINVLVDKDENRSPTTAYFISSVVLRNLKDNL